MRQLLLKLKRNSGMLLAFFWICQFSIVNFQFARAQLSVSNNNSAAHPSAMFEVKSTEKGLLPPRMTTAQRDAIVNPAEGLYLFNLDKNMMEFFNGTEWRQFSYPSSSEVLCGNDFIDFRDNQVYPTILIGTQCWMKKNMNIGVMVNSTVTGSSHSDVSNNGVIEKYCFNNDPAYCAIYGGLYDWNEMMQYSTTAGVQGICPSGWHIPTDAEWTILTDYLGGEDVAGGKMKETGLTHWTAPNIGATNESGFTAIGTGIRYYTGTFDGIKNSTYLTSSSEQLTLYVIYRGAYGGYAKLWRGSYNLKTEGESLRCMRTN
ncbi:MAG: hypothetical protein NTU44_16695 [Bacteroidetes bacterium]|nr:hypothetical protein [Bacteroidota bacterium]